MCYFYAMSEYIVNNELTLAMTLDCHVKRERKKKYVERFLYLINVSWAPTWALLYSLQQKTNTFYNYSIWSEIP